MVSVEKVIVPHLRRRADQRSKPSLGRLAPWENPVGMYYVKKASLLTGLSFSYRRSLD